MADYLNIAGRIRTTASDGVAMEAHEVKDLNLNKSQQEVNADVQNDLGDRYTKEETYNRDQMNELITTPDVNRVYVIATNLTTTVTDLLPATGSSDTLYNVGNWDGTQYDTTVYSIYGWDGTAYVCLAVRSSIGEVYDISANHPDGQGNPTPYADLTAALGTGGANVPVGIRRGGMSIKFIQGTVQSSDNKYVQYRYLLEYENTTAGNENFIFVGNWKNTKEEIQNFEDNIAAYIEPINIFNKDSSLLKTGKYVMGSGDYLSFSSSDVTHPIPCNEGDKFTFPIFPSYYGQNALVVRGCTESGVLTEDVNFATNNGDNTGTVQIHFSHNSKYFCVNVKAEAITSFIVAKGENLPSYSPYFDAYWQIKASALPSPLPLPDKAQVNPLFGKKAAFTGDSICHGAGYAGGFPAIIGSNNNMTISNIGVDGGTLCSGTNRFCISASVDNMPEDYDYYIVEGGVNDASQEHGETLGVLSSGYYATLDTTTLYGAMESLCKKLQLNFKGKKYGFIFPHNTYGDTSAWNTGWRDAMKICLKKWGIPYLDLSEECAQLRNLDALRIYTANSDGWHPNEEGYRRYYVPKIEAWMKTL